MHGHESWSSNLFMCIGVVDFFFFNFISKTFLCAYFLSYICTLHNYEVSKVLHCMHINCKYVLYCAQMKKSACTIVHIHNNAISVETKLVEFSFSGENFRVVISVFFTEKFGQFVPIVFRKKWIPRVFFRFDEIFAIIDKAILFQH